MHNEIFNHAMRVLLDRARVLDAMSLDPQLATYLQEGLTIEADGSLVSGAAAKLAHAERWRFSDRVEYEAFANKIHLDDWSDRLTTARLDEKLGQALLLADRVGQLAEQFDVTVAVIISADSTTADVVFRFHGVRPNEAPWFVDLEKYNEPVLVRIYGRRN